MKKEDDVDPVAGFTLHVKTGGEVREGDLLASIHGRDVARHDAGEELLLGAYRWSEHRPEIPPLIRDRFANGSWLNP